MGNIRENKKLMQRFCKDYNLPINVFNEEMFSYYSELYDFFPKERWENLCEKIEKEYDGNVQLWLDDCADVRDAAIFGVMNTEAYKEFNTCDMSKWNLDPNVPQVGEHSIYNNECVGHTFISIDLKKANFQALKYAGVIDDDTYNSFISKYGGDDYIINSKYLRQVIFGKMNPGRTIKVEKHIMGKVYGLLHAMIEYLGFEFYSFNSDELIFKGKNLGEEYMPWSSHMKMFADLVKDALGVDVRCECILVGKIDIVNANGNNVDAYVKYNVHTEEKTLKKASTTFYPQIYKIWKHLPIDKKDLVFFFEDQLATFNEPLKEVL